MARREYDMLAHPAAPRRPVRRAASPSSPDRTDADGEALAPALVTRAPEVLAPLPRAVLAGAAPRHRHAPRRRARRAARAAAHRRLLLGRRVAVEHALPPRRRRVRRVPGGCRDRQALRGRPVERSARERPRDRAASTSPASCSTSRPAAASTRTSTRSRSPTASSSRTARCGPSSPAPRRSRRSERWRINERVERLNDLGFDIERAVDPGDGRDGTQVAHPAEGRGCRAPLAPPAAAHRPRRRGEPGAPAAQRPRRVPRAHLDDAGDSTRRWSRTSG